MRTALLFLCLVLCMAACNARQQKGLPAPPLEEQLAVYTDEEMNITIALPQHKVKTSNGDNNELILTGDTSSYKVVIIPFSNEMTTSEQATNMLNALLVKAGIDLESASVYDINNNTLAGVCHVSYKKDGSAKGVFMVGRKGFPEGFMGIIELSPQYAPVMGSICNSLEYKVPERVLALID